jgi:hypothetical protein
MPHHLKRFIIFSCYAAQRGLWPPLSRGFLITHNDGPQSLGLLWTSDQLVAETSTWQHITHTTDKHLCPRWNSNPRSKKASDRRPRPQLGPALEPFTLRNIKIQFSAHKIHTYSPLQMSIRQFCLVELYHRLFLKCDYVREYNEW